LLKNYDSREVGIYGCSSGGDLTFQSLAWFQVHHLPRPAAAGILCAGTLYPSGDSYYVSPVLTGGVAPAVPATSDNSIFNRAMYLYTSEANPRDPLVDPMSSAEMYARFPPILFINSTRDPSMSSAIHSHVQLIKAGVDADLHLWDGLEHAFMYDMTLPESHEVYDVVVKFFDRHLGH
jgi:epsilon-lactone hydrolase